MHMVHFARARTHRHTTQRQFGLWGDISPKSYRIVSYRVVSYRVVSYRQFETVFRPFPVIGYIVRRVLLLCFRLRWESLVIEVKVLERRVYICDIGPMCGNKNNYHGNNSNNSDNN